MLVQFTEVNVGLCISVALVLNTVGGLQSCGCCETKMEGDGVKLNGGDGGKPVQTLTKEKRIQVCCLWRFGQM